jgi:hypothetical protein
MLAFGARLARAASSRRESSWFLGNGQLLISQLAFPPSLSCSGAPQDAHAQQSQARLMVRERTVCSEGKGGNGKNQEGLVAVC